MGACIPKAAGRSCRQTGEARVPRPLAIPGVSISVEHLFLSLKHTLSDALSSMTAETVSVDIFTKEWLKSGLAEGVNYTDFIKI
ncbi:hypothetical protein DFH08DRAFT_698178 [Mycena albidolilacea]|uniref:Uncharacterized protein n=1 Tax=Mycena albidolilacea TaxID=1033008 RepID=A0AAD7A2I8_9AGAR|nr:hypothetical protein DFH08DRAFT_698178 [Mycena albidolilacea]